MCLWKLWNIKKISISETEILIREKITQWIWSRDQLAWRWRMTIRSGLDWFSTSPKRCRDVYQQLCLWWRWWRWWCFWELTWQCLVFCVQYPLHQSIQIDNKNILRLVRDPRMSAEVFNKKMFWRIFTPRDWNMKIPEAAEFANSQSSKSILYEFPKEEKFGKFIPPSHE